MRRRRAARIAAMWSWVAEVSSPTADSEDEIGEGAGIAIEIGGGRGSSAAGGSGRSGRGLRPVNTGGSWPRSTSALR